MKKPTPQRKKKRPEAAKPTRRKRRAAASPEPQRWNLRLYVAGQTPRSITAFSNLKCICEETLAGQYTIEVIDVARQPDLALRDHIIALPTLIRKLPEPIKRVIGDLSNRERVMVSIDIQRTLPGS